MDMRDEVTNQNTTLSLENYLDITLNVNEWTNMNKGKKTQLRLI